MNGPSQIGPIDQFRPISEATQQTGGSKAPFADLIREFVADTNASQADAQNSVKDMISGDVNNIHDVVMTASQAQLSFKLMMEIRNRLISSYQEIIRMQV